MNKLINFKGKIYTNQYQKMKMEDRNEKEEKKVETRKKNLNQNVKNK